MFRRTYATLLEQLGVGMADRMAGLGHATAAMTAHYTIGDLERRRAALERLAENINCAQRSIVQ